jgi:hypothetical protein
MKITVGMDAGLPAFDRRHEPVTVGVAFPRGQVDPADGWSLLDPKGRRCPVQATTLDRWSDGSIRWALVDFQADVSAGQAAVYSIEPVDAVKHEAGTRCLPDLPLQVDVDEHTIVVRTGAATFQVARDGPAFFAGIEVVGGVAFGRGCAALVAKDASGRDLMLEIDDAVAEQQGPVRAVVRVDGRLAPRPGGSLLDVTARLGFTAGSSTVQVELSITNPRAARHADGCWDLGDTGSVLLKSLAIALAPHNGLEERIRCSAEPSNPLAPVEGSLELYQDSSGGEQWRHVNHVNRHGEVPTTFRGYRLRTGHETSCTGLRATPVVCAGTGARQLTVAMRHFWENFPKALTVDGDGITVGLWPEQYGDLHELQGGERKTHTFAFCVGPDAVSDEPLFWVRSPLFAVADPASYSAAEVVAPLRAGTLESHEGYEALVNVAIDGASSFRARRECIDEFGWRNFGELYADHESAGSDTALVSHYNNQYDAVAGLITRFLSTGERRWWTLGDELANHVSDIDLYHTRDDRAAYSGGYFWHTVHYQAACTATHRAYSRRTGVPGGGPSNEHNYTTGLMLHHFLTGSARSREAVVQLADWVVAMDDGSRSKLRWIDNGDTGYASGTRSPDYHGPGRGAGNSINALLDAHRLTRDPRYLEKADRLVARCIHPAVSPDALDLLDAENRWSYTVFLQAIGKYLEHRAELGLAGAPDAYARAALLAFAAWMAEHERPYLEHPERLEFPNETWAAQDIRKAAVFEFAARYVAHRVDGAHGVDGVDGADGAERRRYLQRADDFMNYAVSTLENMPAARLTRPIVLLLAYGFQRPVLESPATAARPDADLPPVVPFVPLKRRVLRKVYLAAALSAAALVLLVLSFARLL